MAPLVSTLAADGLSVGIHEDGRVEPVVLGGRELPLSGPGGFTVQEVTRPRGVVRNLGRFVGKATSQPAQIRFDATLPNGGLALAATFLRSGRFLDVAGEVTDRSLTDRALRITFTLPIKLDGWRWENTTVTGRKIVRGGPPCPAVRPDEVLYLGLKGETFSDYNNEAYAIVTNRLPFACVTQADMGLAIAFPLHEPRVFFIRASDEGLSITFSLGVTPATEKLPSKASFRFIIYSIDPKWAIRSAADRYYAFFPELFATRATRHGNYGTFWKPEKAPGPNHPEDFGLRYVENDYQWTNGEMSKSAADVAQKLGVEVFHWREPWSWFHNVGPNVSVDEELAILRDQAAGKTPGGQGTGQYCGAPPEDGARAAMTSYIVNDEGKLERNGHTYECWSLPMNLDPDLPKPNRAELALDWQYRYISRWNEPGFRGPKNFAWDSLDDWSGFRRLNFRREHFRCSSLPVTFDPATGELCQVVGFHDWSFARRHSAIIHQAGGLIMANINLDQAMMFCGQFVDVSVQERAVSHYSEERLSAMRMLVRGKPISFLGGWQPKDPQGREAALRKLLLFGMAPGSECADYERELYRKYMPILATVAGAGWEPVTFARADGLWMERFGSQPGQLFFTVGNRNANSVRGRVAIDAATLGLADKLADMKVEELVEKRPVQITRQLEHVIVELDLRPGETLVLAIR